MPTSNWMLETGWDRYYERGMETEKSISPVTYSCRQCSKKFQTIEERDRHELEHPIINPRIFIQGKELIGSEYTITKKLSPSDFKFSYIDHMKINGRLTTIEEFCEIIDGMNNDYLEVTYSNKYTLEKKLNIRILIASINELKTIDESFYKYFSRDDFTSNEIDKFRVEVQSYDSCKDYSNGIVAYLHGIMAKDQRTERIGFEDFYTKFNQATESLKKYDTKLSIVLRSIISFNNNNFKKARTGILELDQATSFFKNKSLETSSSKEATADFIRIPVDLSTAFIIDELVNYFDQLELAEIERKIGSYNIKYLSQQDHGKMRFIAFRKASNEKNSIKINEYKKKLKNDTIFSVYL